MPESFVSIHVPARGTTSRYTTTVKDILVSIHVPARGTTCSYLASQLSCICFNPRSREGNDKILFPVETAQDSFNPRSREGNDQDIVICNCCSIRFQSTFPRGERQQSSTIFTYRSCSFLCNYTNICFSIQVILSFRRIIP